MKVEVGQYYLIIGHRLIDPSLFIRLYPNGIYGKVIYINRYKITLRCYGKVRNKRHPHLETANYLKKTDKV